MFMNGFILRKFRQVTVLFTLFAAQSLYAQRPSLHLAAYEAKNTQLADSVVWIDRYGGISAYLYQDELDTTYDKHLLTPESETAIKSYEKSSYLWDGYERVREAFLKSLHILSDAQVKKIFVERAGWPPAITIRAYIYKGKIVKTYYRFRRHFNIGDIPDTFILEADYGIRAVQFLGLDSYGLQHVQLRVDIFDKDIQDYTGIKSDYQIFVENQETLWVLDGVVMKDTKGLTMDMLDSPNPLAPMGESLGLNPEEIDNITVLSDEKAVNKYGTKKGAQVVEIKTKSKSKNTVTVDELALRMQRARVENLGMGSKLDIDYQAVEDFVKKNPAAYQALMERFLKDPDSLSKEEAANLYYGFAFTKEYDPLRVDFLTEPRRLYREGKMQEAYDICKKELQLAPVSLSLLWTISQIAGELGRKEESTKYYSMFMVLYYAVTASGNGYSKENAIKVIYISDEYAIFRDMMSLKKVGYEFVEGGYDHMTLDRGNKGETITLWFDANLDYKKNLRK